MKGFPEFIIRCIDEVEIEILIGLADENQNEELIAIDELLAIKTLNIALEIL
jgi:hypothetical protein